MSRREQCWCGNALDSHVKTVGADGLVTYGACLAMYCDCSCYRDDQQRDPYARTSAKVDRSQRNQVHQIMQDLINGKPGGGP